jgi:N-acetyl-anhydromuramyl-L-alanine amidase AmpD
MVHPAGGSNPFSVKHSFAEAYKFVGSNGVAFRSMRNEKIKAHQSIARDGTTRIIVFVGERNTHGRACVKCWGFRLDCNGSRIGQCAEALDRIIH